MNKDTLAMALGNYGYGRWEAPYWFIGPEQGMGTHENNDLKRRVNAWIDLGSRELNDCREFHRRIGETRWHFKEPRVDLQKTWRPLMLLMTTFLGRPVDNDNLRNYQRDRWGVLNEKTGETCVIELSGLAAPNLNETQETGCYLQERIEIIRRRISDHRPKLVVMYGREQKDSWEKIAESKFPPESDSFLTDGPTILAFTPHPVSRIRDGNRFLGNEYWTKLGRELRDLASSSVPAR
jgi:hypothetical protein